MTWNYRVGQVGSARAVQSAVAWGLWGQLGLFGVELNLEGGIMSTRCNPSAACTGEA